MATAKLTPEDLAYIASCVRVDAQGRRWSTKRQADLARELDVSRERIRQLQKRMGIQASSLRRNRRKMFCLDCGVPVGPYQHGRAPQACRCRKCAAKNRWASIARPLLSVPCSMCGVQIEMDRVRSNAWRQAHRKRPAAQTYCRDCNPVRLSISMARLHQLRREQAAPAVLA